LPAARLRRDRHDPVNGSRRDRWALTGQGSFDSLGWLRMAWRNGASLHRTALLLWGVEITDKVGAWRTADRDLLSEILAA
jgi:hypothetical protein